MQLKRSETGGSPGVPAASALGAAGRELRTLAHMTSQMQTLVSRLLLDIPQKDLSGLLGLQRLDYITQGICDIATFLEALAAPARLPARHSLGVAPPQHCRACCAAAAARARQSVRSCRLQRRLRFLLSRPTGPGGEACSGTRDEQPQGNAESGRRRRSPAASWR
jgi:hypothetical protein